MESRYSPLSGVYCRKQKRSGYHERIEPAAVSAGSTGQQAGFGGFLGALVRLLPPDCPGVGKHRGGGGSNPDRCQAEYRRGTGGGGAGRDRRDPHADPLSGGKADWQYHCPGFQGKDRSFSPGTFGTLGDSHG